MNIVTLSLTHLSKGQTKVATIIFLVLLGLWAILSILSWWRNRE